MHDNNNNNDTPHNLGQVTMNGRRSSFAEIVSSLPMQVAAALEVTSSAIPSSGSSHGYSERLLQWAIPLGALLTVVSVLVLCLLYKYLRPILPVRVNCWFCGGLNRLPAANRNNFDCLHCEQYNGFAASGDYNKDIPAQREPTMNVFSAGATPSGRCLDMYHNGLCDLCNHRQTIKIQLRNQFEAKDSWNEEVEFQEYCRKLEKMHGLCATCKQHVRSRISFQDAKLLPHVMSRESARWSRRLERLLNSELTELFACAALAYTAAGNLDGWTRLVPLALTILPVLYGVVTNRSLLWAAVLRGGSICVSTGVLQKSSLLGHLDMDSVSHLSLAPTVLDSLSALCGAVALVRPLQSLVARLLGRKRSLLLSAHIRGLPDLSKALSPLLSPAYRTLLRSRRWVARAPFDLGSRINSLRLGSLGDRCCSPTAVSSFSSASQSNNIHQRHVTQGTSSAPHRAFSRTAASSSRSEIGGSFFGGARSTTTTSPASVAGRSEPFQFGARDLHTQQQPYGRSSITGRRASSMLRPSRLDGVFDKQQQQQYDEVASKYLGSVAANLTPPPSQEDSSGSSSSDDESRFISVSRLGGSFSSRSARHQHKRGRDEVLSDLPRDTHCFAPPDARSGGKLDWDARTSLTQRTVYSTIVQRDLGDSSSKALWAIVALLAAMLVKLCWPEIVASTTAIYDVSQLSVHSSAADWCPIPT